MPRTKASEKRGVPGLGDRILSVCAELGIKPTPLAVKLGLAPATLVHAIKHENSTATTLVLIAEIGRVNAGWLLTGKGERRDGPLNPTRSDSSKPASAIRKVAKS